MKSIKLLALAAGTVLMLTLRPAQANMANGSYSADVGAYVLLWDLSEYYESDFPNYGELDFNINQVSSGEFTGTGDLYVDAFGINLDLPATVSGKSTGSSTDPKVSMNIEASYSGEYDGAEFNYLTVTIKTGMALDSADGILVGKGSGGVKYSAQSPSTGKTLKGSKSAGTGGISFSLPSDVNGDWGLTLDLIPNGTKYTGTAEVMTSVGDTVDFTATGTYSSKKDTSTIALKGTG